MRNFAGATTGRLGWPASPRVRGVIILNTLLAELELSVALPSSNLLDVVHQVIPTVLAQTDAQQQSLAAATRDRRHQVIALALRQEDEDKVGEDLCSRLGFS